MIRRKLYDIKLILRIIISCFIVVNMVRSCAKALTYEDVKEYVNLTADYYTNNSYYQTIKSRINNATSTAITNINNAGNGYQNVSIWNPSGTIVTIKFWNASTKLEGKTNGLYYTGNYKTIQYNGGWSSIYGPTNETNTSIDGGYSSSNTLNYENNLKGMTLINQSLTIGSFPNTFVGNQALLSNTLSFGDLFSEDYTYNGNTIEAVKTSYNYTITFIENVIDYTQEPINIILEDSLTNQEFTNTYDFVTEKNTNSNFEFADLRRLWNNQNLYKAYRIKQNIQFVCFTRRKSNSNKYCFSSIRNSHH